MKKSFLISVLSSFSIIAIWYVASILTGSEVILPSPITVLKSLGILIGEKEFYTNVFSTVLRALESFAVIVFFGTVTGIVAGEIRVLENLIAPLITVFKATPIMSVILILFIWLRTSLIPVFSAFLMAFPIMFVQILSAYRSIDRKLVQMCDVYEIKGKQKLSYLTVPSLIPAFITGSKQTLSMIWKVIIASEVITLPKNGVGRAMQLSQIQLETGNVFAWTLVAIVLTSLSNFFFDSMMKKSFKGRFQNVS